MILPDRKTTGTLTDTAFCRCCALNARKNNCRIK